MQCKNNVREREGEKERKRPKTEREKTDPNKVPQTSSCLQITHNEWLGMGSERLGRRTHTQLPDMRRTEDCHCPSPRVKPLEMVSSVISVESKQEM